MTEPPAPALETDLVASVRPGRERARPAVVDTTTLGRPAVVVDEHDGYPRVSPAPQGSAQAADVSRVVLVAVDEAPEGIDDDQLGLSLPDQLVDLPEPLGVERRGLSPERDALPDLLEVMAATGSETSQPIA